MVQIAFNIFGVIAEFFMIVSVTCLALTHPFLLAGITTVSIIIIGCILEWSKQYHEDTFYFNNKNQSRLLISGFVGICDGFVKALSAGFAIILTFTGSDKDRIFVLACIFAMCLFLGTTIIRRGFYIHGMHPIKWGYFRLAVPLGIIFSMGVQFAANFNLIKVPSIQSLAGSLIFDLPEQPNIEDLSDLAFKIRYCIDALIANTASSLLGKIYAPVVAVLISVNILIGFAIAAIVVIILEIVLLIEGGRKNR
ncbi:MAG: hypothetical protein TECD_01065 [Hyphomicrobiaceae bacterium hypho_1]